MAKLLDTLMNRVIKGKLTLEKGDDVSSVISELISALEDIDLQVKSINAKGGAISGSLAVTGNTAIGGDLDVNKDVRAKTLSQSQANYSFQFDLNASDTTNFERVSQYTRIEVVNGELHIIGLAKFHNTDTESAHNFTLLEFLISNIPDEIAEKIYGDSGNNIKTANAGVVRVVPFGYSGASIGIVPMRITGGQTANQLKCYQPNAQSVSADGNISISFEANLSLF